MFTESWSRLSLAGYGGSSVSFAGAIHDFVSRRVSAWPPSFLQDVGVSVSSTWTRRVRESWSSDVARQAARRPKLCRAPEVRDRLTGPQDVPRPFRCHRGRWGRYVPLWYSLRACRAKGLRVRRSDGPGLDKHLCDSQFHDAFIVVPEDLSQHVVVVLAERRRGVFGSGRCARQLEPGAFNRDRVHGGVR